MNRGYATWFRACVLCLAVAMMPAGCSSVIGLPMNGDVQTMQPSEQQMKRVFTNPRGPEVDAQPESIVKGFFDAMPAGVQSDGFSVARQFLASESAGTWNGNGLVRVFSGSMSIMRTANSLDSQASEDSELTIEVGVHLLGQVDGQGLYHPVQDTSMQTMSMVLTKSDGQWRITDPPNGVFI